MILQELWQDQKAINASEHFSNDMLHEMADTYANAVCLVVEFASEYYPIANDVDQAQKMLNAVKKAFEFVGNLPPGPSRAKHTKRIMVNFNRIKGLVARMIKQANQNVAAEDEEMDIDQFMNDTFGKYDGITGALDSLSLGDDDADIDSISGTKNRNRGFEKDIEDIDKDIYGYDFGDEDFGDEGDDFDQPDEDFGDGEQFDDMPDPEAIDDPEGDAIDYENEERLDRRERRRLRDEKRMGLSGGSKPASGKARHQRRSGKARTFEGQKITFIDYLIG